MHSAASAESLHSSWASRMGSNSCLLPIDQRCLLRVLIPRCSLWPLHVRTSLFCHNAIKCYLWQIKFTSLAAFRLRLNRLPHKELAEMWHLPKSKILCIPKIVNYCLNWLNAGLMTADGRSTFNDWTCYQRFQLSPMTNLRFAVHYLYRLYLTLNKRIEPIVEIF